MMIVIRLICVSLFIGLARSSPDLYHLTMDPEDKFNVSWYFEGRGQDDMITFTVGSGQLHVHYLALVPR